jgi:hypothetical protein
LLHDNNPNEQEVEAFFCDKLSTGRGSTLSLARTNPIFVGEPARNGGVVMIGRAFTFTALFAAGSASAQTPPLNVPARPLPIVSAYCLPVSAGFLEGETKASEEMRKCARGDTVVIPARSPGAVARMCDFSKAVIALGENVVCVLVFPERASK